MLLSISLVSPHEYWQFEEKSLKHQGKKIPTIDSKQNI